MDETTWLTSTDPAEMMDHLRSYPKTGGGPFPGNVLITNRKLLLFDYACIEKTSCNWAALEGSTGPGMAVVAAILRDIFGNVFKKHALGIQQILSYAVLSIAQGIYDERAFDRMPILADALEEYGCREEAILKHCRKTAYQREVVSDNNCPKCGGLANWRRGLHFEHEKICYKCNYLTWEPGQPVTIEDPVLHVRGCWALDLILGN